MRPRATPTPAGTRRLDPDNPTLRSLTAVLVLGLVLSALVVWQAASG